MKRTVACLIYGALLALLSSGPAWSEGASSVTGAAVGGVSPGAAAQPGVAPGMGFPLTPQQVPGAANGSQSGAGSQAGVGYGVPSQGMSGMPAQGLAPQQTMPALTDAIRPAEGASTSKEGARARQGAKEETKQDSKQELNKQPPGAVAPGGAGATAEPSAIERAFLDSQQASTPGAPQGAGAVTLTQFGYNFFRTEAVGFAPLTDIPVGPDYQIDVGDRLMITLWGSVDGSYEVEVGRNGEIVLPRVGPVKVAGVTYGQLPSLLTAQVSKVFRNFQLSVTMGRLRTIKVYLVGEVTAPGDYTISSLSTLINALAAAGGPTKNGSLRNIAIKRGGRPVERVDLYDFFLKGDKSRDIRLQPGDTVFVPVIGPVAGVAGNVRRPAIFELKGEKTLADLLALSGDIVPTGYLQRLQITRIEAHHKKVATDLSLDPHATGKNIAELAGAIPIQELDMVRVFPINMTLRGYARLDGYALRPGDYAIKPGMRVSQLLLLDNILPETNLEIGEITRLYPPDFHAEKILFNVGMALSGSPKDDLELKEFDRVRIFSRTELEEAPTVRVSGEVQHPAEFKLLRNMTVRDLLVMAGNPRTTAYLKSAEIKRVDFSGVNYTHYSIYIDLEEALKDNPQHNIKLQKFDELFVKKWFAREEQQVFIGGEVRSPGAFRYVNDMTLRDLVIEAGNIKKTAYLNEAEIVRRKVKESAISTYPINVNLEKALNNDPASNIKLEPFDMVTVRMIPDWVEEADRYVTLKGAFRFPGAYPIFKGERLSDVIRRAGGFTPKAYLRAAKFTRVPVREQQQKRMDEFIFKSEQEVTKKQSELAATSSTSEEIAAAEGQLKGIMSNLQYLKSLKAEGRMVIKLDRLEKFAGSQYDIELMGGDTLDIPQRTQSVSVLGKVVNPTSYVALKNETVEYYLEKAGGVTKDSEEDEIYVVRVDGSVFSKQQYSYVGSLFGHDFFNENLDSGDTIVVPERIEQTAWLRNIKDITTILGQIALSAGTVILGLR